jgi:hypothetical protein
MKDSTSEITGDVVNKVIRIQGPFRIDQGHPWGRAPARGIWVRTATRPDRHFKSKICATYGSRISVHRFQNLLPTLSQVA